MRSILLHLHPVKVSSSALRFNRTFGLGGMAALLIVIQIFTGILLRFYYVPSPAGAYDSILFLTNKVLFGPFIRNIHYWSGVFLLIIAFLHFLRVFFTGAYPEVRSVNWLFGLLLLLLVVFANFTGYLLPWDQLAYWAITVSTNIISYLPFFGESLRTVIIGGSELNAETLQNFFTFHTAVLPVMLAAIVVYHFWRVRKAGGIMLPGSSMDDEKVTVMPNLIYREFITGLVLLAVLFTFAALINAPLLEKANPVYSMNPTKAPWYFAGVQELLMHFHPFFAAFVIPISVMAFLVWIPFLKFETPHGGHWFISDPGKRSSMATAIFAAVVTLSGILVNEFVLNLEILLQGIPAVISNGIIPFFILLMFMTAFYWFYLRKHHLAKAEFIQAVFVFIMVAFIVLTITGIFFRGKDMELAFPWNV
jgi:quinol-cytochrome oxidoreductase complex cytochrome b subunit